MAGDQQAQPLSSSDRALVERLFSNPLALPTVFKQWLVSYLGPAIEVTRSQVVNATAPAAYTQTYSTADRTLNLVSTAAFTGQNNSQAGTVYAKSADLEQLRADLVDAVQTLNALIDDLQTVGLIS